MNCLDFRRHCTSEPDCKEAAFLKHRGECPECGRFAETLFGFDRQLQQALQVDVPEELAARIKLKQLIGDEQQQRQIRPWRYAVAASVLLLASAAGVSGYRLYQQAAETERLQLAVLEHINLELPYLQKHDDVQAAELNRLLSPFGARVRGELGPVRHAGACQIGRRLGAHLVLDGQKGPVTVIYVAGKRVADPSSIVDNRFSGVLRPAGYGSLAVVGEQGEPLDDVVARIEKTLSWSL